MIFLLNVWKGILYLQVILEGFFALSGRLFGILEGHFALCLEDLMDQASDDNYFAHCLEGYLVF